MRCQELMMKILDGQCEVFNLFAVRYWDSCLGLDRPLLKASLDH